MRLTKKEGRPATVLKAFRDVKLKRWVCLLFCGAAICLLLRSDAKAVAPAPLHTLFFLYFVCRTEQGCYSS